MKNRSKIGCIKLFNFGDEQKNEKLSSLVFSLSSLVCFKISLPVRRRGLRIRY